MKKLFCLLTIFGVALAPIGCGKEEKKDAKPAEKKDEKPAEKKDEKPAEKKDEAAK